MSLGTENASAYPATPGKKNNTTLAFALTPPAVTSITHSPQQPKAAENVLVTAAIQDPDGIGTVTLSYQLVDPGAYIRATDSSYSTTWINMAMNDAGLNDDVAANDGIYSATLPANLQTHRRLVRYRVTAIDLPGNSQRFPYEEDEQRNFAYFVYNGIPAWTGKFDSSNSVVTYSAEVTGSMPAIHLIANGTDVENSQYKNAFNKQKFSGTIIQRGIVYDNVSFRNRGQGSTYQSGKNKWKINFNRARDFQAYDNYGRPYAETWNELPINANASPWVPMHRGSAGLEEASSHRLYQLAGMAAINTQYFQFRVIDEVSESGSDQHSGDLWGLYMGFEPTEGNFLGENNLPDGNLYSIEGNNGDQERQGPPPAATDGSDWITFRNGIVQSGQTESWYRANVDLDALYTFMAINRLIGNVDLRPGDNYRFYHRPTDDRWVIIPYDLDMMYVAAHHWGGSMDGVVVAGAPNVFRAIMRHPNVARDYRNRCREILSLVASNGNANGGQIGQLLNEYSRFVNPPGQSRTWADIDAALWNQHPRTTSGHKGNFYKAQMTGSWGGLDGTVNSQWLRQLQPSADYGIGYSNHENLTQWFINYATNTWTPFSNGEKWNRKALTSVGNGNDTANTTRQKGYGYQYLKFECENGGWGNANVNPPNMPLHLDFPEKPTLSAVDTSYNVDNLSFLKSSFSDPNGSSTFASTQWRIAQISSPGGIGFVAGEPLKYEIQPTWTSSEINDSSNSFRFPIGVAEEGKRYRVRSRQKDTSGNWSYWSEPIEFDATAPKPYALLHYWNFNAAPEIKPTYTVLGGTANTTGAIQYATAQSFAALNARNGDVAASHQRLNTPLTFGSELKFNIPTTGFKNILVKYETRRSVSGAGTQIIDYSTDKGANWNNLTSIAVPDVPDNEQVPIKTLDFGDTPGASNNPNFLLRITFAQGAGGTGGNNRFDNFTVEGRSQLPTYNSWAESQFSAIEMANHAISGPSADPFDSGVSNLIRYATGLSKNQGLTGADGESVLPQLQTQNEGKTFRFRYNPAATDLVWKVKASSALMTWNEIIFDSQITFPVVVDGWVSVPIPTSLVEANTSPDQQMFLKLEVTSP